jgi:predicted Zn finger-like uncharacterized protein
MQLREFKEDVKVVVEALAAAGVTVQHTVMLEAISKGFGERTWLAHREALASLAKAAGSKEMQSVAQTAGPAAKPWKQEDGPMSDEQYLAVKGVRCPYCGSYDISSEEIDADGGEGTADVECDNCGKTWTDLFGLRGYIPRDGDGTANEDEAGDEDDESGFFADGEFVSVWDGGHEVASPARLNLDTGLVDQIELVESEDVTTLDGQFFRVANAPDYQFSLVVNDAGAFVGQARLKQIRRLLRVENPHAKAEFALTGMSLAETYSCVKGLVVEQFADGTAGESVEYCLMLNGALVSYDPVRRRQVNEAGSAIVSRYFVPSLDSEQDKAPKFLMTQLANVNTWPLDPYKESFHLGTEDIEHLRTLVRQGKLIVGAVELAALVMRIRQLQSGKASYEKALQSDELWKINAAKGLYDKQAQRELDFLTELQDATLKGYKAD